MNITDESNCLIGCLDQMTETVFIPDTQIGLERDKVIRLPLKRAFSIQFCYNK